MSIEITSRNSLSPSPNKFDHTSSILQNKYNVMISDMKPKLHKGMVSSNSGMNIREPHPKSEANLNKFI